MLYGITYMVRPCIEPANRPVSRFRVSSGSRQLFVGPASSLLREQMNVNSSTRATSAGSERTKMLLGRLFGSSRIAVPARIMCRSMAWYSAGEPSHHTTCSGRHIAAVSWTQACSFAFAVMELAFACMGGRGSRRRFRAQPSPGTRCRATAPPRRE